MDIMLRAFWRSGNFKNTRRWIRGRVLLTGSTGFLGGFLLRDLIRLTKVMNTFAMSFVPNTNRHALFSSLRLVPEALVLILDCQC